ncbi:MAG: ABC transporter permease subunit [Thermoprotei archaeon]
MRVDKQAAILALPAFIYLLAFAVYPIIDNVVLSFQRQNYLGVISWAGLHNYFQLATDPFIARVVENTVLYMVAVPIIDVALAIPLAVILKRVNKTWVLLITLLPAFIPFVTASVAWLLALNPFYGVAYFLFRTNLFNTPWMVVVVDVWESMPLATLIIYAGLRAIPKSIEEASMMDNVIGIRKLLQIDLPYVFPSVLNAFVLMLIFATFTFDPIYVFEGVVAPLTNLDLAFYSYSQFFSGQPGYAAVLIIIMSLLATAMSLAFIRTTTSRNARRIPVPKSVPNRQVPYLVTVAVLCVYLVFLLFPFAWLIIESLKTSAAIYYIPPQLLPSPVTISHYVGALSNGAPYLISSLVVAAFVLVITVVLGAPAAFSMARYRFGGTKLLGFILYVYSLPAVIFMLPLFYIVYHLGLINTWWGLIITYPVFVLPVVVWMMYNSYSNFPPSVDEAGQMDGMSKVRTFFRVVLPLSGDAIGIAALYSFLISWGSLVFPLVLTYSPFNMNFASPSGAQTFSIFIGGTLGHEAVHYGSLAAASIISVVPAALLLYAMRSRLEKIWNLGGGNR